MTTSNTKRSFGVSISEMATEIPLLDKGIYAGVITGAAVVGKENKQHIVVGRETGKWNKDLVNPVTNRQGMFEYVGDADNLVITGTIYFGATLNSKSAIQQLQIDEPKVFGGQIRLNFDKETLALNLKTNPVFVNWLIALGLQDVDFASQVDFEYDDNIEVPEEWAHIPNIVDILNSRVYQVAYLSLVCDAANNLPCKVSVERVPESKGSTVQVNTISTGNFNSFGGVLAYVDGDENDLND